MEPNKGCNHFGLNGIGKRVGTQELLKVEYISSPVPPNWSHPNRWTQEY